MPEQKDSSPLFSIFALCTMRCRVNHVSLRGTWLPMRFLLVTAVSIFLTGIQARAWWSQTEYSFGGGGFKGGGVSAFANISTRVVAGIGGTFEKDGRYPDAIYTFKAPLSYSGRTYILSLKPFIAPGTTKIDSSARGASFQALFSLSHDPSDGSYTNLTLSAAGAEQRTAMTSADGLTSKAYLPEASAEVQLEKSFFNEFFFLVSATGFRYLKGLEGKSVPAPALDHSEMSFMGTVLPVYELPSWAAGFQFARNMAPDSDSTVYLGYHRINYELGVPGANSATAGIKIKILEHGLFDFAYNWVQAARAPIRNYYRFAFNFMF